jgi:hypothetical protein
VEYTEIDSLSASVFQESFSDAQGNASQSPGTFADYPNLPGATHCYDDAGDLSCLTGDVLYALTGQDSSTDSLGYATDQVNWVEDLELPLAEKLGSEFAGSGS